MERTMKRALKRATAIMMSLAMVMTVFMQVPVMAAQQAEENVTPITADAVSPADGDEMVTIKLLGEHMTYYDASENVITELKLTKADFDNPEKTIVYGNADNDYVVSEYNIYSENLFTTDKSFFSKKMTAPMQNLKYIRSIEPV